MVTVQQAGVREEVRIPRGLCGILCELEQRQGYGGPWMVAGRVLRGVSISMRGADPAQCATAGHGSRHAAATGCEHVAERGLLDNLVYGMEQYGALLCGKLPQ